MTQRTEAESETEAEGVGSISKLSAKFVELTGIVELTGGARRWNEALLKIEDAGGTPEILEQAHTVMVDKGLNITGPWSMVNPVIIEVGKHLTRKPQAPKGYTAA